MKSNLLLVVTAIVLAGVAVLFVSQNRNESKDRARFSAIKDMDITPTWVRNEINTPGDEEINRAVQVYAKEFQFAVTRPIEAASKIKSDESKYLRSLNCLLSHDQSDVARRVREAFLQSETSIRNYELFNNSLDGLNIGYKSNEFEPEFACDF